MRSWVTRAVAAGAAVVMIMSLTGVGSSSSEPGPSAGVAADPPRERELIGSGAWSWFGDPRAVYHAGAHRRTYVGWIDSAGNVEVASYDHDNGRRTVGTLTTGFQVDDHNNPSLLMRPDGHLLVFWSGHGGSQLYYRRSASPEDVSSWEPTRTVPTNVAGGSGYTYPNPVQLSAEGNRIHLFWRGGNNNPTISSSSDGLSWSQARTVISSPGHRPYVKYHGNGSDTIAMAFTEAHPRNLRTSIYYAAYRNGAFHRADGTRITTMANLPFTPAQADKVYDAAATGAKAWVHDVTLDPAGRPVIVYAVFPTDADHRYRYARWDGTTWRDFEITRAGGSISEDPGEPNYSGGITLDHEDPSTVYLSRQVNGVFEVETWRTATGGSSWTRTPVTSGSTQHNYRPVSPRGQRGGDLDVVWMHGRYPGYTRYQTGLRTLAAAPRPADPAAVAWDANRLDVAARDADTGELLHKYFTGTPSRFWSGWERLGLAPGGHRIGAPAIASWGPRRLDIFAVDQVSGHLMQRTFAEGWQPWVDRGGGPAGHPVASPSAVSWGAGRIDVFARDTVTSDLIHYWQQDNVWRGPERLAGSPGGAFTPTVASWASRRLDVFAVTSTGTLAQYWFDGTTWHGWENHGAGPNGERYGSPAAAVSWDERRIDVFAPGAAATAVAHTWYDQTRWQAPQSLGLGQDRPQIQGMATASRDTRMLTVLTVEPSTGSLLHLSFTGTNWTGPERLDFAGPPA